MRKRQFRGIRIAATLLVMGAGLGNSVAAQQNAASPRGTVWVAAGMEDQLTAVDLGTREVTATLPVGANPHILTASADGRILYVINAGEHDREPHSESKAASGESAKGMDAGSHGMATQKGRATGGMSGHDAADGPQDLAANSLWAVESATGRIIARVPVGLGPTHPLASADGRFVYVTNTDGNSVSVIDTRVWNVIATIEGLSEPHDAELTPDGRLLYVATSGTSSLSVVDTEKRSIVASFSVGTKPRGVAVGGRNGEIAYVTNKADGTMTVVDVREGVVRGTFEVGSGAHALRVTPDGRTIYVALSKEDAVGIFDTASKRVVDKIPVGSTPEQIDLSADGSLLFASNNGDGTMTIIRTSDRSALATVPAGEGAYGVQMVNVALESVGTDHEISRMGRRNDRGYIELSATDLSKMMPTKEFALVNVHVPYEGKIPKTDLLIPYNEIGRNQTQLPGKDDAVVLYCRSGSMSKAAADTLVSLGYTNVMELKGGFNAWRAAGHSWAQQ